MFRLLGFPVHVRPGFVMFMVLIVVLYGDEFGVWLAASLAGFTLLHELGHAVAARRTGAHAEISLNFLAGYASYVPSRPLTRLEQIGISFAGPGIQIVVSVGILLAMGANPLEPPTYNDPATLAIWWAGPVIGLFNLVPIYPLDGGNIVTQALGTIMPDRAERVMVWFSLAVTTAFTALAFVDMRYRGFVLVIGFLFIAQVQALGSTRQPSSPWHDAHDALKQGKTRKAQRIITTALSHPQQDPVPQPLQLSTSELAEVLALLPSPLPTGDPWNEYLLANVLIRVGRFEDAAHYAAASYERTPHTLVAATVARAAAALGDQATALGWLRAAADANTSPSALAHVIDTAPELIGLREHPTVTAIRRTLVGTP